MRLEKKIRVRLPKIEVPKIYQKEDPSCDQGVEFLRIKGYRFLAKIPNRFVAKLSIVGLVSTNLLPLMAFLCLILFMNVFCSIRKKRKIDDLFG